MHETPRTFLPAVRLPGPSAVRLASGVAIALPLLAGCRSPLGGPAGIEPLARVMQATVDRELRESAPAAEPRTTAYTASRVEQTLSERRERLEELTPAAAGVGASVGPESLGEDLFGRPQQMVELDLSTAVRRAIARNLGLEQARLQPAIDAETVIDAEAAFDATLFAETSIVETDRPAVVRIVGGTPVTPGVSASRAYRFATGIDRRFDFGGSLRLQLGLDRTDARTPGGASQPDPACEGGLTLGLTQPLLRDFGRDVNRAVIRLSRNARSRSAADLERSMLDVVRQVEAAYHELVLAWRLLEVQQWLVAVGI